MEENHWINGSDNLHDSLLCTAPHTPSASAGPGRVVSGADSPPWSPDPGQAPAYPPPPASLGPAILSIGHTRLEINVLIFQNSQL